MKVKSESEVNQLCPTPSDPMDCSLPSSSIHGILEARVLEWVAIAFSESTRTRAEPPYTAPAKQSYPLEQQSPAFSGPGAGFVEYNFSMGPGDGDGEGNGTPLQYSCLENPMGGGAW